MRKFRLMTMCIALILCMAMAIGGIYAYLTARDASVNKVTIGDVHISAWEPNWPTEDKDEDGIPDESELLVPYDEVSKDPRIRNTGTNDCIVFFRITSPVEELTVIDDDGTRHAAADVDLFYFKQAEDSADEHANHWDENWVELTELDGKFVTCDGTNEENKGYTYIFGYHVRLAAGETTSNLFDKIQNKKYGSRTISANEAETIRIEACAIQADEIYQNGKAMDTSGELTEDQLTCIYRVFFNQNADQL
ncbi:MAG: hypothetical protein LUE31_02445 [Lachnospiraceae bacterium]|nr:hypothetical protein [Lachnospiraceae bacterium]